MNIDVDIDVDIDFEQKKKVMEPRRGVRERENGLLKAKARGPTKNPQISLCSKNRVRE